MYLSIPELSTHLYSENIDAITRGDDALVSAAIDAAIQEAKGYLSAYDKPSIFNATGESRNALLLTFVKDIAAWHFINLCNAGVDFKLRQDRYERAVAWLKGVQKGDISPDLPLLPSVGEETNPGAVIKFGSNEKRNSHF